MTESINQTGQGSMQSGHAVTSLEALFNAASQSEPLLVDSNFTKVVLNRLPADEPVEQRQWMPDFVGMLVALFAIWWAVEPTKLVQNIAASVPSSVIISVPNMLFVALTLFATAIVGWWIVERDG